MYRLKPVMVPPVAPFCPASAGYRHIPPLPGGCCLHYRYRCVGLAFPQYIPSCLCAGRLAASVANALHTMMVCHWVWLIFSPSFCTVSFSSSQVQTCYGSSIGQGFQFGLLSQIAYQYYLIDTSHVVVVVFVQ